MKRNNRKVFVLLALLLLVLASGYVYAADIKKLALNTTIHSAPAQRQADTWQINVPAAGKMNVVLSHENLFSTDVYWTAQLLAQDMETVLQEFDSKGTDEVLTGASLGVTRGTYYVRVYARKECGHSYSDKPYGLNVKFQESSTWEIEYNSDAKGGNDSQGKATPMKLKKNYYGTICDSKDVDFFKVVVPGNGYLTLTFSHPNIYKAENYWTVQLVNSKTEAFYELTSAGTKKKTTSTQIGVSKGTYYVKVTGGSGWNSRWDSSDYTVYVKYTKSSSWEQEYGDKTKHNNNTMSYANTIKAGKKIKGTLSQASDVDFYKVKISSTRTVNINFAHEYMPKKSKYWTITIYNSKTKEVMSFTSRGIDKSLSKKIRLKKGTYFIKISQGTKWNKKPYTLKIK